MTVINRKIIYVNAALAAASSFTNDILVEFQPTHVIIRQIVFRDQVSITSYFTCSSDMVDNRIMFAGFTNQFVAGGPPHTSLSWSASPETIFDIQRPVKGTQTFTLLAAGGALASITGNLGIILEFIEEK